MKTSSKFTKNSFKVKKIISFFLLLPFLFPFILSQNKSLNRQTIENYNSNSIFLKKEISSKYEDYSIKQISTGLDFSGAIITNEITKKDELYTWGNNEQGQLGLGYTDNDEPQYLTPEDEIDKNQNPEYFSYMIFPQYVNSLPDGEIKQISMGGHHSAAIVANEKTKQDEIYTWGSNSYGQLGNGGVYTDNTIPKQIKTTNMLPGEIESISLGEHHSAAILTDIWGKDHLYTWGRNTWGQTGLNSGYTSVATPDKVKIPSPKADIEQISMGGNNGAVVIDGKKQDSLYMWGLNSNGQLGLGFDDNQDDEEIDYYIAPELVDFDLTSDYQIEQISLGTNYSAVVLNDKDGDHLYTWGNNNKGQLGLDHEGNPNNDTSYYNTPQEVESLSSKNIEQIAVGRLHSAAVVNDKDGDHLYTWGSNEFGQLGLGEDAETKYNTPQEVIDLPEGDIKQIALGQNFSAAIINKGNIDYFYAWGRNDKGQLGLDVYLDDEDNNEYAVPQQVDIFPDYVETHSAMNWYFYLLIIILITILIGLFCVLIYFIFYKDKKLKF